MTDDIDETADPAQPPIALPLPEEADDEPTVGTPDQPEPSEDDA